MYQSPYLVRLSTHFPELLSTTSSSSASAPAPQPFSSSITAAGKTEAQSPQHPGMETSERSPKGKGKSSPPLRSSPILQSPGTPPPLTDEELAIQTAQNIEATQQAENTIQVDNYSDQDGASDPGYETDSIGTASTSLASSVRNYRFENGRRYHRFRDGAYNFPNDDAEQDREDTKHAMMVNLCQVLHFAPIGENPQNILDMGTGTGIWAIEMGDQYPSATVLGVDLSPIQPSWVPPNVKFMVDDVESPWLHPENMFDLIHSRHLVMAVKNWPKLMKEAYDHLKPGGYLELQEIHHFPTSHDGTLPATSPVVNFWALVSSGLAALGVDFGLTLSLAQIMRDAGFINVTERIFHIPIGTWPKNKVLKVVGLFWRTILTDGLQPIALGPLCRGLKWSREEVEVFLVEVRRAYADNGVHAHMPLHVIHGQKPLL